MGSDFSEVYGSISLKLCMKKVKQIVDIIQNGGLVAIFDVNTPGAITWRTSPGFRSNLVQRDCIGGATCMPFISCLVSKVATEWPFLLFYPPPHPFSGSIPPNFLGIRQSYFVHPQTVLLISIPFQRSYIGRQASCYIIIPELQACDTFNRFSPCMETWR